MRSILNRPDPMSFDPRSVDSFTFRDWRFEPAEAILRLRYRLDPVAEFEESIHFEDLPGQPDAELVGALAPAFELIHLLAGVSYYKAAVPRQIRFEGDAPDPLLAAFCEKVYANGLGEFAYRNGLTLHDRIHFPAGSARSRPAPRALQPALAVPLGGGKDSLVTAEALRAHRRPFRLISVGRSALIEQVATAVGKPHIRIRRELSAALFKLNQEGAYNGHVPISAILAAIMTAAGPLYGFDTVVMSNESSANAANVVLDDGFEVNHQYSKSLDFERDFQHVLEQRVLPGFRYFSLLRPLSEVAIARRFATLADYHPVFSSCNRNFRILQDAGRRWCCECPKCRFVYLCLAPHLSPEALIGIFGQDLLDDPSQRPGFEALLGLEGFKPFECVGELDECRSLMRALGGLPAWRDRTLVAALSAVPMVQQATPLDAWLGHSRSHCIPPEFLECLDAPG